MAVDDIPAAAEAKLSASTKRLMLYLVGIHIFAFAGFWLFLEWTTAHYQQARRFIPVRCTFLLAACACSLHSPLHIKPYAQYWEFPDHAVQQEWRVLRMEAGKSWPACTRLCCALPQDCAPSCSVFH